MSPEMSPEMLPELSPVSLTWSRLRLSAAPVIAVLVCAVAACGGSSSAGSSPATSTSPATSASTSSSPSVAPASPSATAAPAATADWPTYHRDNTRAGLAAGPAPAQPLKKAWSVDLDGAVYGQPLVVGGSVIAATENNSVYALDPVTGAQRWKRHLGTPVPRSALPCGNIDPLGITGTAAYDAATGSLFVVTETAGGAHTLWALDATSGAPRWHRGLDTQTSRNRLAEQERAALLVTHGRVITTFGGLAGDCDNYVGYATSVPTSGKGATTSYAVPTAREAGMWSPAGAVTGPSGHVYIASGNGAELGDTWDKSDSVTELDAVSLRPLSVFAPTTWAADNRADLDLGSSSPVPVGDRIVIAGKRGTVYLLPSTFSGIGHEVTSIDGCPSYGGAARKGSNVVMPCSDGVRLLHVGTSTLSWGWQVPGVTGSPVIAGGDVFATNGSSGELVDIALSSGAVRSRTQVGAVTRFASPTPYGGRIFVPTLAGITAVSGG